MKISSSFIFFFMVLLSFSSCKKDGTQISYQNNKEDGSQLMRIQQGTDPATDTVFEITYYNNNISSIYDSVFEGFTNFPDALRAEYAGNLLQSAADDNKGFSALYIYDTAARLKEIDINFFGETDLYYYTYSGNNISQKTWYSDFDEGIKPVLYKKYDYTVANGNITEAKTYDSLNTLIADATFTYSNFTHAAVFRELALLDIGDFLYLNDFEGYSIGGCDTYFNNNMMTGYTNGATVVNFPNILNDKQLPIEVTDTDEPHYVFTWQFSYR